MVLPAPANISSCAAASLPPRSCAWDETEASPVHPNSLTFSVWQRGFQALNKCSALLPCNGQVLPLFWSCIQAVFMAQALQNVSNIISIHLNQQEISWIIIESGWSYLWHPKFHSLMQFFISLKVHHNSLLHTVHCFLKSVICYG